MLGDSVVSASLSYKINASLGLPDQPANCFPLSSVKRARGHCSTIKINRDGGREGVVCALLVLYKVHFMCFWMLYELLFEVNC